jgi:hypothetical protein
MMGPLAKGGRREVGAYGSSNNSSKKRHGENKITVGFSRKQQLRVGSS